MLKTIITTALTLIVVSGCSASLPITAPDLNSGVANNQFDSSRDADKNVRLRLFFGLSKPDGGAVSIAEWESFRNEVIVPEFDGFNVVDSVGFYKGQAERSKIVTLILPEKELSKAKKIAKIYADKFDQDSVMIVVVPVLEWVFVGE